MPTIFFRGIILYIILVLTMRCMGKRQLGQFQPYEFALTMLIANLIATPMSNVSTPLLHGLLPVAALLFVHTIITVICLRSDRMRAIISGKPVVVVTNGMVHIRELKQLSLSLSDLLEGIRESGILNPYEVGVAIVEADGSISAFPRAAARPPTAQEMNVAAPYEGMPLALVMDGRVQVNNLATARRDEKWLAKQLEKVHLKSSQVFLSTLDTQGRLSTQDMSGNLSQIQAMPPQEVMW